MEQRFSNGMGARLGIAAAVLTGMTGLAAAQTTTITFDDGSTHGWQGHHYPDSNETWIDETSGNPGASLRTIWTNFDITWWNNSNPAFVQDLTQYSSVSISVDVKVNSINFWGTEVDRTLMVGFRDYDNVPEGQDFVQVWYALDDISAATHGDWTTLDVTIDNPASTVMPDGWGGYGDYDPDTYEPILPEGWTFADVLAGYDEIVFSTSIPGMVSGFVEFDVQLDNISITTVPTPGGIGVLAGAGLFAARRRR